MRVRKMAYQKTRSSLSPSKPVDAGRILHTNLCDKYNHTDKYFYLRGIAWTQKKQQTPSSIKIKDYNTMYQKKEVLDKYLDLDTNKVLFGEVINYYKYYEDIPRVHLKGFERIILKHVEAKRVKKYSDLKFLVQEGKEGNSTHTYSEFMPLLKDQLKTKTKIEQETLICLKEQLSYLLQQKSWIEPLETVDATNLFSNPDTKRLSNISKISTDAKVRKQRRNWGSLQLKKSPEFINTKLKEKLQKRTFLRFKTMNTPNSVQKMSINQFNKRLGYNQKQITNKENKKSKGGILSSTSKSRMTPSHTRMHSQPFCNNKAVNVYLASALEMHKSSQISRLKKRRKHSNLVQKESIRI